MIAHLANSIKEDMLAALATRLNTGAGRAAIDFYAGIIPANAQTAITAQVLLGHLECAATAVALTGGQIVFNSITRDNAANATGIASFVALYDPLGALVGYFDVTATGGDGAVQMNTTSIVVNGPIEFPTFTIGM